MARPRRHRLGHVQQPEHRRDDGHRPAKRRGIAGGARTMLQNTGAVISIAFVLAIITAAVPKDVLFSIFSGHRERPVRRALAPFIANMHTALWVLAATSVVGAFVCLLRPRARRGGGGMTREAAADRRGRRARRRRRCAPCATTRRSGCCRAPRNAARAAPQLLRGRRRAPAARSSSSRSCSTSRSSELRGLVEAEEARAAIRAQYRSATEAAERERLLDGRRGPPRPPARADPRPPGRARRARGAPGRAPRARRRAPGRAAPLARAALSSGVPARSLPVHQVKIDRSFVTATEDAPAGADDVARAVLLVGQTLGPRDDRRGRRALRAGHRPRDRGRADRPGLPVRAADGRRRVPRVGGGGRVRRYDLTRSG